MRIHILLVIILLIVVLSTLGCGYGSKYMGGTTMPGTAPKLAELVPNAAPAGTAEFIMTINGTGFGTDAVVFWNGTALTTSYVTGSQITATVPTSDVATAGKETVYVRSSAMNSNMLTFTVQ